MNNIKKCRVIMEKVMIREKTQRNWENSFLQEADRQDKS